MSATTLDAVSDIVERSPLRAIAALAAHVCAAPIALIAVLEKGRHRLVATSGFPSGERFDASALSDVLEHGNFAEVNDTLGDARLREHEWVRGAAHMRFIACAPLRNSARQVCGSLCVIDCVPRGLNAVQRVAFEQLAIVAAESIIGQAGSVAAGARQFVERAEMQPGADAAQSRAELVLAHQRLQEIADNMPVLISYVDEQERYQFFNRAYREWFGRDCEIEAGMTIADMIGAESYERARPYIQRCLSGEKVTFENHLPSRDRRRHALVNYVPRISDGMVVGFYILASDLTAQKEAEDQLFQEKERLAVTLQSIGDGVITTDTRGKITYMNPLAEALTGWRNAQAVTRPLSEVFTISDAQTKQRAADPVMLALATNAASGLALNTVLVRADGSELPIEDSAAPIHDRSGNVIGGVLVFHDQHLEDEQQLAFSRQLGLLEQATGDIMAEKERRLSMELNDISNLDKHGELLPRDDRRRLFSLGNMLWHSDSSFKDVPAKYSLLSARTIPGTGGNTEFADMRAAYDTLDEATKREVRDLICSHSQIFSRGILGFDDFTEAERVKWAPVRQRLVRRHPNTGRLSLYLSSHAGAIEGWPVPEARALLRDLTEHATQRQFVYAHVWRQWDLVMWDNRVTCTAHGALTSARCATCAAQH